MSSLSSHVCLNGEIMPAREARVSPLGDGFQFGRGVFETLRVARGRPAFFEQHVARLTRSAEALRLPWAVEPAGLLTRCERLLAANQVSEGGLKVVVYAEVDGPGELILTRPLPYTAADYARGFRLRIQRDARTLGAGPAHKATSYLHSWLAREAARQAGFDEALFVDDSGRVLEGASTNLFAVVDGALLTPRASDGILPGIVRGEIIRRFGAREAILTRDVLASSDEVFVTNALLGIMPVSVIDGTEYDLTGNPLTREVGTAFAVWTGASARGDDPEVLRP